ncbi:MAG: hypothetical protein WCV91_04955 [Candidatus Margulisiibacteriota bacterium]
MAIQLYLKDTRQLSWYRHPIDRFLVNRAVKKIADHIKDTNRSNPSKTQVSHAFVTDYLSHHRLGRYALTLQKAGVIQISLTDSGIQNGYLAAHQTEKHLSPSAFSSVALVQLSPRDEDLGMMRTHVEIIGAPGQRQAATIPATDLFDGNSDTCPKNMSMLPVASGYSGNYVGPGRVVDPQRPRDGVPLEGELSILRAVGPVRDSADQSFSEVKDQMPSIIIKDETRPSSPLSLPAGGLMGYINFGTKRLYQLVYDNARFLLASLSTNVQDGYTVFMGKSSRYIKFFGKPMVGTQTLDEATAGPKAPKFMILTRPLSCEAIKGRPVQAALVDKKTGKVKYVLPSTTWSGHVANLRIKMGAKFAGGMKGREILEELGISGDIRKTDVGTPAFRTKLEALGKSTVEIDEIIEFAKLAQQDDLWETEWEIMEVIPGAFVAQKEFLDCLNVELEGLTRKYQTMRGGKSMERVLREGGNRFSLENFVYLAMFSSDRGERLAGFVGKFGGLKGVIDPAFLQEAYTLIRETVFAGQKIYAINVGEATEVINFTDEKEGKSIRVGEHAYTSILQACTDYSSPEEWEYWRSALALPTSMGSVNEHSFVGAWDWRQIGTRLKHWWKRDLIVIDSSLSGNFIPKGSAFIVGSRVTAEQAVAMKGPFYSIYSDTKVGEGLNAAGAGVLAYHRTDSYDGLGINNQGVYVSWQDHGILGRSGEAAPVKDAEFPFPVKPLVSATSRDTKTVDAAIPGLSPQANALRDQKALARILDTARRGGN